MAKSPFRVGANAVALVALAKLYLDGIAASGDTYLVESAANVIDVYAGGVNVLRLTATGIIITGTLSASGDVIHPTKTPASATAAGTAGTVTWDANYIYICTATNTWKRVAIATW